LNSTVHCLLHKSQPHGHTLSYYLSYNLMWPNIYPCVFNTGSFLPSSFVVIILNIFLIPGMCSTCFTHPSHSTNSISSVTYDTCCRLYLRQLIVLNDSKARLNSALIQTDLSLCHSDSALFSNITVVFSILRSSGIWKILETWICSFFVLLLSSFFILPSQS